MDQVLHPPASEPETFIRLHLTQTIKSSLNLAPIRNSKSKDQIVTSSQFVDRHCTEILLIIIESFIYFKLKYLLYYLFVLI